MCGVQHVTCFIQNTGAMSNATRRQQDTFTSKGKYWATAKLAHGSDPLNEKVNLIDFSRAFLEAFLWVAFGIGMRKMRNERLDFV